MPRYTIAAALLALVISITTGLIRSYRSSDPAIPATYKITGADTSAWHLGIEHAAAMVRDCNDDDSRALRLLDVRARESNIRMRLGPTAGDAYIEGFEHGLHEASDSLARVILD